MNSIVVPHADALDALARLYPADAAILRDAAAHLRHLSAECQRRRDLLGRCRAHLVYSTQNPHEPELAALIDEIDGRKK